VEDKAIETRSALAVEDNQKEAFPAAGSPVEASLEEEDTVAVAAPVEAVLVAAAAAAEQAAVADSLRCQIR